MYYNFFTTRYMRKNNDNPKKVSDIGFEITKNLQKQVLKLNKLIIGKPIYDLIIGNNLLLFKKNWNKSLVRN